MAPFACLRVFVKYSILEISGCGRFYVDKCQMPIPIVKSHDIICSQLWWPFFSSRASSEPYPITTR